MDEPNALQTRPIFPLIPALVVAMLIVLGCFAFADIFWLHLFAK